jgi:hypothetical protein
MAECILRGLKRILIGEINSIIMCRGNDAAGNCQEKYEQEKPAQR